MQRSLFRRPLSIELAALFLAHLGKTLLMNRNKTNHEIPSHTSHIAILVYL